MAHELLDFLSDLVLQYDAVLHTDLMSMRRNYFAKDRAYRTEHPGFIGASLDPLEMDRFNKHLNRLCDNESFMRFARMSLEATLCAARHSPDRLKLVLPDNTAILNPTDLAASRSSPRRVFLPAKSMTLTSTWSQLTQYLANGFSGSDGAWFYPAQGNKGSAILINWDRLIEIAKNQKYEESPLARILAFTSPTAGYEAKGAFNKATGGTLVYQRKTPLTDYILPTGLPSPAVVSHPWELYSATALAAQLNSFNKSDAGLRRARLVRKRMPGAGEAKPKQFKVVYDSYGDKGICIIRRPLAGKLQLCYTLPYTPDDLFLVSEYRKDKSVKLGSDIYWTTQGINQHANGIVTGYLQAAPEPEARLFLAWTAQQEALLYGKGFQKALFDQARPQRIGEYTRGDRKSLGFFTDFEDETIKNYFLTAPSGKMDAAAREYLRRTLPGRSTLAINRRREHHGLQLALQFGWAKYCQSGYCANRSQKRKIRWAKLGVTL
jgi:hypothetical protein